MLGTLRLDVETCIREYQNMAPDIFPVNKMTGNRVGRLLKTLTGIPKFKPGPLENALKTLIERHLGNQDTALKFEDPPCCWV